MSRSALLAIALASALAVVSSSACTVNGKAIGPHLGGTTAAAPTTPAPPPAEPAAPSAEPPSPERPVPLARDPNTDYLAVPDVRGMTLEAAQQAAIAAGFPGAATTYEGTDAHVPEGQCVAGVVCGQRPAPGARLARASKIAVFIKPRPD